jgi:hypothetical protein
MLRCPPGQTKSGLRLPQLVVKERKYHGMALFLYCRGSAGREQQAGRDGDTGIADFHARIFVLIYWTCKCLFLLVSQTV